MAEDLLRLLPAERLWLCPSCGLGRRTVPLAMAKVGAMVHAARLVNGHTSDAGVGLTIGQHPADGALGQIGSSGSIIALRSTDAADSEFVRTVHHQAYREVVVRQFGTWDPAFQDRHFAEAWAHGSFSIVLYDGQPCGYLGLDEFADHLYVREIVIAAAFQGRGIGTALLEQVLQRAGGQDLPVRLQTLHANHGAAALYRRLRFEQVGSTSTHLLFEWRRAGAEA
jgi:ribosomal protein S18 acetylase RimI-like enzyme